MADRPLEQRTVTAQVEYRDDEQGPMIVGHAATFNQPYQVGFFTETIHPEAFKRTLSLSPDVRLLVDHEGQPLARTKSGTLELGTDSRGLTVRATLDPSDPDVQRLIPKMRRGDLDQMSFAFSVPPARLASRTVRCGMSLVKPASPGATFQSSPTPPMRTRQSRSVTASHATHTPPTSMHSSKNSAKAAGSAPTVCSAR